MYGRTGVLATIQRTKVTPADVIQAGNPLTPGHFVCGSCTKLLLKQSTSFDRAEQAKLDYFSSATAAEITDTWPKNTQAVSGYFYTCKGT
jgi:hypothetical protein